MPKERLDQLIEYVTTDRFSDELQIAKREHQKIAGEIFEDDKSYENRMTAFLEWYIFDRILSDKMITPLELFIDETRDKLTFERLQTYENFIRHIHGIFIVKKIKEDHVVVYNMFDQEKYVVHEKEGSIFFRKNDIFEGRILPLGDKYYFTGTFCYHPADALKFIKTETKKTICEKKQLEKSLKKMNSDLESIESKLIKTTVEAEKMKAKVDKSGPIYSSSSLEEKLNEITARKTGLEKQASAMRSQIMEWQTQKIKLGYRQSCEQLIQKLSYMSLKWERSRQIALSDIYRNA